MKNATSVLFVLFAVVLTACGEADNTETVSETAGISMHFLDNTPPDVVFDNSGLGFQAIVIVENVGGEEIPAGNLKLSLRGIFPPDFGKTSADLQSSNDKFLDKVKRDPDNSKLRGGLTDFQFPRSGELMFHQELTADQTFPIRVDACYSYKTTAVSSMCINADLLNRNSEVCSVISERPVDNSGAPVHVTSVKQTVSGQNSVLLTFNVEKLGPSQIQQVDSTSECKSSFTTRDRIGVEVITGSKRNPNDDLNSNLKCIGLIGDQKRSGGLVLRDGKATFSCIQAFPPSAQIDAVTGIQVILSYQVKDSISKNIVVKHQLGGAIQVTSSASSVETDVGYGGSDPTYTGQSSAVSAAVEVEGGSVGSGSVAVTNVCIGLGGSRCGEFCSPVLSGSRAGEAHEYCRQVNGGDLDYSCCVDRAATSGPCDTLPNHVCQDTPSKSPEHFRCSSTATQDVWNDEQGHECLNPNQVCCTTRPPVEVEAFNSLVPGYPGGSLKQENNAQVTSEQNNAGGSALRALIARIF